MQLRTGRIGLGAYLRRINRRQSALCDCDLGNQTSLMFFWSVRCTKMTVTG